MAGKGKDCGVPGADFTADFVLGILEIKNLLELGNGLKELGLQGCEEGEDFLGGGAGGVERRRSGGGLGLGRKEGGKGAAKSSQPKRAIGRDFKEAGGERGHLDEDGLSSWEWGKEGEQGRRGGGRGRHIYSGRRGGGGGGGLRRRR